MNQVVFALPMRHKLMMEALETIGPEAGTYLLALWSLRQDIGPFELTPKIVARECGIRSQKIKRIFSDLKRLFEETSLIIEDSCNSASSQFQVTCNSVSTEFEDDGGKTRENTLGLFNKTNNQETTTTSGGGSLFSEGVAYLVSLGEDESSARSYLGRLKKLHGEGALNEAISITLAAGDDIETPRKYIAGCAKRIAAEQAEAKQNQWKAYAY